MKVSSRDHVSPESSAAAVYSPDSNRRTRLASGWHNSDRYNDDQDPFLWPVLQLCS